MPDPAEDRLKIVEEFPFFQGRQHGTVATPEFVTTSIYWVSIFAAIALMLGRNFTLFYEGDSTKTETVIRVSDSPYMSRI